MWRYYCLVVKYQVVSFRYAAGMALQGAPSKGLKTRIRMCEHFYMLPVNRL